MKAIVSKGDYTSFKYQMPTGMRDIDARRLMNEMRHSMGLELIKEDVRFSIDALRDKYFKGEIYHIGDIVESAGEQYEIMDRGSNYLVVVNKTGDLSRKWVKDVSLIEAVKKPTGPLKKACWKGYTAVGLKMKNGKKVPNCVPEEVQEEVNESQISYKGYTSKNMHHCSDLAKSFKLSLSDAKDPVAMLNAIKTTDAYMDLHNHVGDNPSLEQLKTWKYAHIKAKEDLQKIGHFDAHQDQWIKDKEQLNKLLAPHGIKEDIDVLGKYNTFNIQKSYKTYRDFMKANKVQPGFVKDTRIDQNPIDPNVSQQIDDLEPQWPRHPQTKVGSTLANRDHHRRQKVSYHLESVEPVQEITQKLAGNYLDKVTKQNLAKHGMQHDMYGKLPKNRQKGVANAFKRLEVDKEGKPVHHLVTKEDYIKGDLMDEDFANTFYEANGGEIGDGAGDDKIKKVKTLPPNLVKNDGKRLGGGTRDHTFSAFMEKQKKTEKEDFEIGAKELMNYRLAKENK
jgi:hypothetical protein